MASALLIDRGLFLGLLLVFSPKVLLQAVHQALHHLLATAAAAAAFM
jgi:hypothetical protein